MRVKTETWTVAGLFLKLGVTAFGGPAAHIALMRREVVDKRRWLSEEAFLDLVGATNLIPGPNSTEMAIHIGYLRAGGPGLILAGLCFIVPAMLMVMGLAWIYVGSGSLPQVGWLLYGVKPVVVALLLHALWNLGRKAIRTTLHKLGFIAILALYFLGGNEIALLLGGGGLLALLTWTGGKRSGIGTGPTAAGLPVLTAVTGKLPFSLGLLFLKFLRMGSVLYGSGYVLLPFLRRELVERSGWLSETQLLDAVSVGQFTPGPFFTTASFIGYLLGGVPGGLLATLGIFLPAFCLVAVSNPFLPRLRKSPALGRFLDGVNVASLALMAGAAWQMGKAAVTDAAGIGIFAAAAYLLFRRDVSSTWLIAGGGLIGIAARSLWAR
jgi:chromate transporter